ncbi:hypothetical protein PLICRDRAFT_170509 [Plicaturopsis crispa FD-325 SS-3]|nr:hypothetical protein PLICRDRAFT_170509 [Plicaturopsis crispa FD-325 SS-3]
MAARKLQTEIDRTLKKVGEGVELFESIYDKMQASTNMTQKEKLETDLKTQIKKLQRLRDQIKTWVASNDIKDKSQLLDNRRLIETQMEKFKACEKEMKTKAFSKEGLIQSAKLDPKQQEKLEVTTWLQTKVEELLLQVEQSEAEIESIHGAGKKKSKTGNAAGRLEELERLNERRKWHISRLEIVLRLLDNGSMSTEKVTGLKEDVSYFVESNTDDDFEEDEGIYDELNLDEEEEKFGLAPEEDEESDDSDAQSEDLPPRTPAKKQDEESLSSSKRDSSPILKKAAVTLQLRKGSIAADSAPKPPPNPNFAQQPMASILKAGLPQPTRPALPPIRYAAAAAAAVASPKDLPPTTPSHVPATATGHQPTTPSAPSVTPSVSATSTQDQQSSDTPSSPSMTHPSVTSPMLSSASVSQQQDGSFYSGQDSPALSEAVSSSLGGPAATSSPQRIASRKASVSSPTRAVPQSPSATQILASDSQSPSETRTNGLSESSRLTIRGTSQSSSLPQQVQQHPQAPPGVSNTASTSSSPVAAPQQPQFPPGVKVPAIDQHGSALHVPQQSIGAQRPTSATSQHLQPPRSTSAFPGSLSDLVVSFENVKQKAAHRMASLDQAQKLLEGGYRSMPQPQDTEKPKYYVPRNPYQTPAYYPQSPNPVLSTAAIFSQLDVETLFYVFYFLPGTYQQYLAAKELKRQSWRFHVKYLTWFQRHSEPQAITEEYEQGVYVYFDWEGSWCQRKKSDFRFEYRYLSED